MSIRNVAGALVLAVALPVMVAAHCQIPCGIYDDMMRIDMLNEDVATIEKSMKQITELSAAGDKNYNQIVRWVVNKENHADKFMEIVTDYFMAQRLKPADATDPDAREKYLKQLELLHQMLVAAMKCKQTTDLANTAALTDLVSRFKEAYFTKEELEHGR